jgi:hypothetical protein
MSVQARADQQNFPFVLTGEALTRTETLLTDAGRTTPLVFGTLMAKIAATGKWVPFTDETAVDGTAIARGIFCGDDVAAADLVAGDVVDQPIYEGGCFTFDTQQLVIENSKLLTTVVDAGAVSAHTVQDDLEKFGMFAEQTVDIDELEN